MPNRIEQTIHIDMYNITYCISLFVCLALVFMSVRAKFLFLFRLFFLVVVLFLFSPVLLVLVFGWFVRVARQHVRVCVWLCKILVKYELICTIWWFRWYSLLLLGLLNMPKTFGFAWERTVSRVHCSHHR